MLYNVDWLSQYNGDGPCNWRVAYFRCNAFARECTPVFMNELVWC